MTDALPHLPEGWHWAELSDVLLRIESGKSVLAQSRPAEPHEFGVLKLSAVTWGEFNPGENKALSPTQPIDGMPSVRAGDILISRANTVQLIGAVVLVKSDYPNLLLSDKTLRLLPRRELVLTDFLLHALRTRWVRNVYEKHATGTSDSMRNLSQDKIRSAPIALPPLVEQRRIVAKIEALQVRSRKAREALEAIPLLLAQFRQSVLAAAFRGDLTADWRANNLDAEPAAVLLERIRKERRRRWEEANPRKMYVEPEPIDDSDLPELPEGWCWTAAEEVVEPGADIIYGIVQPGPQVSNGVPYVRGCDIEDGVIKVDQLLRTSAEIASRYERASLRGGDVLLGIIRATKVAIVPDILAGSNITQGTARFRPSNVIKTGFQAGWLDTPFAQGWLHKHYRGIDMPGLNLRDVRRLPVPLAPLGEQNAIVSLIARSTNKQAILARAVNDALSDCAKLDQSILAQAFRGELVPQDPADESAAALLERVQAEKNGTVIRRGQVVVYVTLLLETCGKPMACSALAAGVHLMLNDHARQAILKRRQRASGVAKLQERPRLVAGFNELLTSLHQRGDVIMERVKNQDVCRIGPKAGSTATAPAEDRRRVKEALQAIARIGEEHALSFLHENRHDDALAFS